MDVIPFCVVMLRVTILWHIFRSRNSAYTEKDEHGQRGERRRGCEDNQYGH